jgi:hypothetical protein
MTPKKRKRKMSGYTESNYSKNNEIQVQNQTESVVYDKSNFYKKNILRDFTKNQYVESNFI